MRISDWSSDVCSSDLAIASRFLIALPCYAAILFAHFNIKLWIPHINPTNFDASYWALDQLMRPVVDACMFLRRSAFFFIPYESNFYMISYIALFYTSFLYHAIKTPEYFRSEEHTSELQSLMRNSYAVFCLIKKTYLT